jgi:hypothetical protein
MTVKWPRQNTKSMISQSSTSICRAWGACGAERNNRGGLNFLDVVTKDPVTDITAIVHLSVYVPLPVLRSTVEVQNTSASNADVTLQLVSSLVLGGITLPSEKWWKDWRLHFAHNGWFREAQWQNRSLPEVGLDYFGISDSSRWNFAISNQHSRRLVA